MDSMAGAAAARKNAKADGQAVAGVDTPMVPTQSAEEVSPTGPTLAGEFADAEIRVGDDYQAVVPEWDPKLASAAAACDERGDELLDIKYKKLTKPPGLPTVPVPPKASAETEESAVAPKSSGPSVTEEEYDVDEDGLPILPAGCCVGAFCLAYGTNAGQRKQFKAKIMAVRELYPHVLVKYVGDFSGSTSALLLPEVRNSYVAVREVQAWQRLVTPPTEVEESSSMAGAVLMRDCPPAHAARATAQRRVGREAAQGAMRLAAASRPEEERRGLQRNRLQGCWQRLLAHWVQESQAIHGDIRG